MEKTFQDHSREIIESVRGKKLTVEQRCQTAIELTEWMLKESQSRQTAAEKKIEEQLARMMADPIGKVFTTSMTDQCFRSDEPVRVTDQLVFLLQRYGVPQYLSRMKRMALSLVKWVGKAVPWIIVPAFKKELRHQTETVILPGEPSKLKKHILKRNSEGVRVNLNHLGEAILGEKEAAKRLEVYLKDLENPEVECISVKISTICSQLNLIAWEKTLEILEKRLELLYKKAMQNTFKGKSKFVYLDMEEYRDLHLTVAVFERILSKPEFFNYTAGIVLQAYLPDSHPLQKQLTAWAMQRVSSGGAPVKIRIVKGANLAMEQVEASNKGWQQAPYSSKADVDANFKQMVQFGMIPNHAKAVKIGVASHNLFDIAYAMLLRAENSVEESVGFEMLEGMADHIRRVVQDLSHSMLLYCPSATQEEFVNAVAYLVRRLDENTAPNNFLRHLFGLKEGTKEWKDQVERFVAAAKSASSVAVGPQRKQNRLVQAEKPSPDTPFRNEADTDWSLSHNRLWITKIIHDWSLKKIEAIPLVIGGKEVLSTCSTGIDPSNPKVEYFQYHQADRPLLEKALETALKKQKEWANTPVAERALLMKNIAHEIRLNRGELIGAMLANTGKIVSEADAEISEAIDFAEYYARSIEDFSQLESIQWKPKGTVLIAPPWNFSCAIPLGGIVSALVTGNCVIFKPSPEAVLVGWVLANLCWKAGVSKEVLQFVNCPDHPEGSFLIQDPRLNAVVLTGATSTAKMMLKMRPGLDLLAETGGKNAIIVTNMSDRDLAIKEIIHSAFSHSGQKCSACSLVICLPEVYNDPHFKKQLSDAAHSLHVGSAWDFSSRVNPIIASASPALLRGLTELDEGEEWALKPAQDKKNPQLWSPGIKWGVKPGSFTHLNELFGPVLGVMYAKNLKEAIELVNSSAYGLTSGIQSLDKREVDYWIEHIQAGNLYVNRGITGAIVQRQPFGGCKESSFGPGHKAGGPNYLLGFMSPIEKESDMSYEAYWNSYFSKCEDVSHVMGQDNLLKYVSQKNMAFRIQTSDSREDIQKVLFAAKVCGTSLILSDCKKETDEQFMSRVIREKIKRIRFLSEPSQELKQFFALQACNTILAPVVLNGRVELTHYLREVSISIDFHRYGNLGERE